MDGQIGKNQENLLQVDQKRQQLKQVHNIAVLDCKDLNTFTAWAAELNDQEGARIDSLKAHITKLKKRILKEKKERDAVKKQQQLSQK